MSSANRRAAARRKAWGRGPMILRFEPLESRQLLTSGMTPMAVQAPTGGRPDLVITAFDTFHNLDHGEVFNAVGVVENLGSGPAPAGVEIDVYASPTPTLGANAVYVGAATLEEPLAPGGKATFREALHAPPVKIAGLGTAETYHFVAKVDPADRVAELNEANNGGSPLDPSSLVTITPKALAILSPGPILVPTTVMNWGRAFEISAQLPNNSGEVVPSGRARVVMAPEGQSLVGPNAVTVGEITLPAVGVAQTAQVNGMITLPAQPPGPLAGASRFVVGVLGDAGNVEAYLGSATVRINPAAGLPSSSKADLSVVSLQPLDSELSWSMPFRVRATVENDGRAASGPLRVTFSLIDARRPDLAPLAVSDAVLPGLAPGFQQEILQTIPLNGKLPEGLDLATVDGRIVVRVDSENAVDESNESNNQLVSAPVTLKLLTREGRTEVPKPGPVITAPAPTPPTPQPNPNPPATPQPNPNRPQRPTREQMAERLQARRAMLKLRTEQARLGLRVVRDQAPATPRPRMNVPISQGPKAS